MNYALAWQRKNTIGCIGWCLKRWQQIVNNWNRRQDDDGWSTAGMFVTFPKIETLDTEQKEASKALISGIALELV